VNAPRIIAIAVAIVLGLTAVQTLCWHERAPEGWRPAWWQSRSWALAGIPLLAPAWLAGGVASLPFGGNHSVEMRTAFIAVACLLYVVVAYLIVLFVTRWLARQFASNPPKT
jgi:hypothetical protein